MARQHILISNELSAALEVVCGQFGLTKSKVIRAGIQMAIDDAMSRFGEASNDPLVTSPPEVESLGDTSSDEIASIRRGDTTWFEMSGVCSVLGVNVESLLSEIDPEDDVLTYLGKDWIDTTGVGEARSLCRDHQVSDTFWAWAQTKINSNT